MSFSLKELKYFVSVADHSSITEAASVLHVSQPSVSLSVAELEKQLGVQLFVRQHARGVALTQAGADVLREARKLLAQASDLESVALLLGNELRGRLKIGCLPYLVPRYLPAILAGFTQRYPDIEVDFIERDQSQLVQSLMSGEIEVALSYNIVAHDHRLASRKHIGLNCLANDPVVLLDLPISREYYNTIFNILNIVPNVKYRTTSVEAVRSFVANRLGYSILNHRSETTMTYDGSKLVALEITDNLPSARIAVIMPSKMKMRRVAEAFMDFAKKHFCDMKT